MREPVEGPREGFQEVEKMPSPSMWATSSGPSPFAPGLRGGRFVDGRRSGPTTKMSATTLRQGPGTPAGACPWEGRREVGRGDA